MYDAAGCKGLQPAAFLYERRLSLLAAGLRGLATVGPLLFAGLRAVPTVVRRLRLRQRMNCSVERIDFIASASFILAARACSRSASSACSRSSVAS